jgi:hypothetical protein
MSGPPLDFADGRLGVLDRGGDGPAPPLVPVVAAVQPVIGLPIIGCDGKGRRRFGKASKPVEGLQDRNVDAGLDDHLPKRHLGIAASEFTVGRNVSARIA